MDGPIALKAFFALVVSFLITFYLVPLCCKIAYKLRFIDEPDGKIKVHKNPTPYMGGVAVYMGFLAALCLAFPFENNMFLFFVGATLLLFVGLIDDLLVLKPYQKFFGHILATFCFLKGGFHIKEQFFYHYWSLPISALWILSIINAFNLVDVMDGLATTIAIGVTISFLAIGVYSNQGVVVILLCAFLGPLLAFLWYNKPTAKIYLGDAGSLFIGGLLATIPFFFNWGIYNLSGYLTPIIIFAIPLLEVFTLILVRSYKKIPFYQGSPDHFSIYLQRNGWSKVAILKYVALVSGFLFVVAFLFLLNLLTLIQVCALGLVFLASWFKVLLGRKRAFTPQNP